MSIALPTDLTKVDPRQAWQPWEHSATQPWDAKWAAHLFRRSGFGRSITDIDKAVKDGFVMTFDRVVMGSGEAETRGRMLDEIAEAFTKQEEVAKLRGWWLYAMLHGGHPLREKMTLFWHNHFATSIEKVQNTSLMFRQNQRFRKHALGSFAPMLREISRDTAMLIWLDSNQNVREHPNENFAREVMELFTLGVGNYQEKDIQEVARAFTGWHTNSSREAFEFRAEQHDFAVKTVLGVRGELDGDDVLKILLEQPCAARFLIEKIYHDFISETSPPKGLLDPLCEQFRKSDYDIGKLMKTMLGSRFFFSDHAYLKRIKSPVEFILGAVVSAWPGPVPPGQLVSVLDEMGQALFAPPNVKGWVGGKLWLNNATLLARNNFAERVAMGGIENEGRNRFSDAQLRFDAEFFGKSPSKKGEPQEVPPPPAKFDVLSRFDRDALQKPEAIVSRLANVFMPGGFPEKARKKIEAFVGEGEPKEKQRDARIREAAHAIMCMPEYQLC